MASTTSCADLAICRPTRWRRGPRAASRSRRAVAGRAGRTRRAQSGPDRGRGTAGWRSRTWGSGTATASAIAPPVGVPAASWTCRRRARRPGAVSNVADPSAADRAPSRRCRRRQPSRWPGSARGGWARREWCDPDPAAPAPGPRWLASGARSIGALARFVPDWHGVAAIGAVARRCVAQRLSSGWPRSSTSSRAPVPPSWSATSSGYAAPARRARLARRGRWVSRAVSAATTAGSSSFHSGRECCDLSTARWPTAARGPRHDAIRAHLAARGASLWDARWRQGSRCPGRAVGPAWWGNDTFAPLGRFGGRGRVAAVVPRGRVAEPLRPSEAAGRWSRHAGDRVSHRNGSTRRRSRS